MAHLVFFIAFMFYVLSLLAMCLLLCRSLRFLMHVSRSLIKITYLLIVEGD